MIYIIKQEGLYQNKVISSLVFTCNCKVGCQNIIVVSVFLYLHFLYSVSIKIPNFSTTWWLTFALSVLSYYEQVCSTCWSIRCTWISTRIAEEM